MKTQIRHTTPSRSSIFDNYLGIEFDSDGGAKLPANRTDESDARIPEGGQIHFQDKRHRAHG